MYDIHDRLRLMENLKLLTAIDGQVGLYRS